MHRIAFVACFLIASAAAAEPLRFVGEPDIKKASGALEGRMGKAKGKSCPRPILQGKVTAGKATSDLLVFERPRGPLATCLASLEKLAAKTKLLEAVDARSPDLVAFDKQCGKQLETAVRKAVSHEDSCSPFQVGGGLAEPAMPLRYVHVGHALALRIRMLGDSAPNAAAWMALDLARFGQDLGRGSPALAKVIGESLLATAIDSLRVVLERRKLDSADLDLLAGGLDRLQASTPSVHDTLAAETDYFLLYYAYGPLQKPGWKPPGGWPDGAEPSKPRKPEAGKMHPRDQFALLLVAGDVIASKTATACPPNASLMACHAALSKLVDPKLGGMGSAEFAVEKIVKKALADPANAKEAARVEIRDQLVNIFASAVLGSYPDRVARSAEGLARIAAARHHVDVLKAIDGTKKCPAEAELVKPRVTQPLGDSNVTTMSGRSISIAAPKWTAQKIGPYWIACP